MNSLKLGTWRSWITLLRTLFALPMDDNEFTLFKGCTGRKKQPDKPFRELWAIVGRRGGKTRIMSLIATYLGLFYDYKEYLAPGERAVIQLIAADRQQAKVAFRYISAILHSNDVFEQYVTRETADTIELSTGIDIVV